MASKDSYIRSNFNSSSGCFHEPGAEVNLTVPASGEVVIQATFVISYGHTSGVGDEAVVIASNTSTCGIGGAWWGIVGASESTGGFQISGSTQWEYSVTAGTSSYYVDAETFGTDEVEFWDANLVAVYYPA
jgi:hypothetical protein